MTDLEFSIELERPIRLRIAVRMAPGEILAVVGPSGAGKTSLLRAISGALRPAGLAAGRTLLCG